MNVARTMFALAGLVLSIAAGLTTYWHFYLSSIPIRIAVAPADSEVSKFFIALAERAERTNNRIKITIAPYLNVAETTAAIDSGDADLAYARADYRLPASGLALAILHQNIAVLARCPAVASVSRPNTAASRISRPVASINGVKDLRNRHVLVVGQGPANVALLHKLLALHGITRQETRLTRATSGQEIALALKTEAFDALFIAGARGEERVIAAARAYKCAGDKAPDILPITESGMLAASNRMFSAVELAAGELSVNPLRPENEITTLGFPMMLIAHDSMSEDKVNAFLKLLFEARQSLAADHPAATWIESLPTDRGSAFTLHPGAAIYYDAEEESFLSRNEVLIYLVVFGFSGVASGSVWLRRYVNPRRDAIIASEHQLLQDLIEKAHRAATSSDLDEIERQLDRTIVTVAEQMRSKQFPVEDEPAISLLAERAAASIDRRRSALGTMSQHAEVTATPRKT